MVCCIRRIAKQAEAHYSAAQSTPKSDALQRNMGRTIPVRSPSCPVSSVLHLWGPNYAHVQVDTTFTSLPCKGALLSGYLAVLHVGSVLGSSRGASC